MALVQVNLCKNMAHNIPAVCDGLTARIKKCVAFLGLANCAGAMAWEWSEAEWPSHTEPPERPKGAEA